MSIDKSWIHLKNRMTDEYWKGTQDFLRMAAQHLNEDGVVKCPCRKCVNVLLHPLRILEAHIIDHGFHTLYTVWEWHGETRIRPPPLIVPGFSSSQPNMDEMIDVLHDVANECDISTNAENDHHESIEEDNASEYDAMFEDLQSELWPGCQSISALNFMVKLMHIKVMNKWTNSSFNQLCQLLTQSHPDGNKVPKSHYDAKQKLRSLGLGYESIHVCKYDCILFWRENLSLQNCPVCGTSRWVERSGKGKKVPQKVLRYFPIKDRLRRLYSSRHTANEMLWHRTGRSADPDVMRHPVDGEAWKDFDRRYPQFAAEPRNVRLGLAADGFNPFGNMAIPYSMWPVVLTTYNLPPWLCMKEPYMMLTLLIPGPSAPGKDMDVFLRPLVEELKELWSVGAVVRDSISGNNFRLRAALLWTVNDFPARSSLSGWSGQGYKACPTCNDDTPSVRGRGKTQYVGHRRWLSLSHPFRRSKKFNGQTERRPPPERKTVAEILHQLSRVPYKTPGKHHQHGGVKRKRGPDELNWSKKSIFFELEYWANQTFKHNLDVMHIERNVCDSLLGTLLDIEGKSKDTIKAREDLKDLGIRSELHLYKIGDMLLKPQAQYTLIAEERKQFVAYLKGIRFPDGFASNLQKNVNEKDGKISGLKSHDCHIIMQRLLAPGIRVFLPKDIRETITELCNFFRLMCARTLKVSDVRAATKNIVVLLCKLELIFPPAFFDIMVHLVMHLPEEALQGGPVHARWMYPFERYIGTLKHYVRNRARPEGSIAEGYVVNEALTFCSMYFHDVETRFNRPDRHASDTVEPMEDRELSVFKSHTRFIGKGSAINLEDADRVRAEWYIFNNCSEIESFKQEHVKELEESGVFDVPTSHQLMFPSWFRAKVFKMREINSQVVSDEIYALASGSLHTLWSYTACVVNGVKFVCKQRDCNLRTQNSGVYVPGIGTETFYGELQEILVLQYLFGCRAVLFRCKWFDTDIKKKRLRKENNITSIYINAEWYKQDPYIFSTQAEQVFYTQDLLHGPAWNVVHHSLHRHIWDLPKTTRLEDVTEERSTENFELVVELPNVDGIQYHRHGVVDNNITSQVVLDDVEVEDDREVDDTVATYIDDHDSSSSNDSNDGDDNQLINEWSSEDD